MEGLALAMRAIHPGLSGSCKQAARQGACESLSLPGLGQSPLDQVWSGPAGALARQTPEHCHVCHEESEANAGKREVRASRSQKEAGEPGRGGGGGEQEEAGSLDDSKPCHGGAVATRVPEPWGGGMGPPVVPTVP